MEILLGGLSDCEEFVGANQGASWVTAAKTPIEHVMVHFSEQEVSAMMNSDQ